MTPKAYHLEVVLIHKLGFFQIFHLHIGFPSIMGENTIFISHYLSKYSLYELLVRIILEVTDLLTSGFGSQRPIFGVSLIPRLPLVLALATSK